MMLRSSVTYFVDPTFNQCAGVIASTIEQFFGLAGWHGLQVEDPRAAHLAYSADPRIARGLPVVPAHRWLPAERGTPVTVAGVTVPSTSLIRTDSGRVDVDVVHAAYYFFAGIYETDTEVREPNDTVPGEGLGKWGLTEQPTIDVMTASLLPFLSVRPDTPPPRRRWPPGKHWALSLTHDCDRLRRYRPAAFWRDAQDDLRRRCWRQGALAVLKAACSMPMGCFGEDPYEASLRAWVSLERELGIRSAFYIGVWGRNEEGGTERDFPYTCDDPRVRVIAHWLQGQGWEIGLHSAILAWSTPDRFATESRRFQSSYGVPATGFRGHYWSLDPENRVASLARASSAAGFEYDTSLGMNRVAGFRSGTCYPFRPFDPVSGRYAGLWEIPPTMMDGSLFLSGSTNAARMVAFDRHIDAVRRHGGVAVLDWHSDSLYPGYMDDCTSVLVKRIREFALDSSCWIATPREILAWCRQDRWANAKTA